jgi:hypothetical protein
VTDECLLIEILTLFPTSKATLLTKKLFLLGISWSGLTIAYRMCFMLHTWVKKWSACCYSFQSQLKLKYSIRNCNFVWEHQRANDYSTQQYRNSNNSSSTIKMTASKHSYKALLLQNSLNTPCGRWSRKCNRSRNLLYHLEHQKEQGQEPTSKKHTLSLNT